jgi:hypothetical protein
MSLTTMRSRMYGIVPTIESIFAGTVQPDRLFVFLSNHSHLLDAGVSEYDVRQHEIMTLCRKWPVLLTPSSLSTQSSSLCRH